MHISRQFLAFGVSWVIVAYGFSQIVRFICSILLARLLSPEIFGVMAIVYAVRNAMDVMSDMGIRQFIVSSKDATEELYNTAWSIQIGRGVSLWILSMLIAWPVALVYNDPAIIYILPVISVMLLLSGFTSVRAYVAIKRMQYRRLTVFEALVELITSLVSIIAAFLTPSAWALVAGLLVGSLARVIGSFVLVPGPRLRLAISKKYATQILNFSKWITLSSTFFFFSSSFDSFYLAKQISFNAFGVYAIARGLSQQGLAIVTNVSIMFVNPMVSGWSNLSRSDLRRQISGYRGFFLALVACALSFAGSWADLLFIYLYDARYQAAGWMISPLIIGSWFSILCVVNESMLLGLAKPAYGTSASATKLSWLLLAIPVSFLWFGLAGVVIVVATSDAPRYVALLVGQSREGLAFGAQDSALTAGVLGGCVAWAALRWSLGLGLPLIAVVGQS